MKSSDSTVVIFFIAVFLLSIFQTSTSSRPDRLRHQRSIGQRRAILSFKDTPKGSNVSFDCSPSGPCVPCLYSEKKAESYRCSETGYRIPLTCVEVEGNDNSKSNNNRQSMEVLNEQSKSHEVEQGTESQEARTQSQKSSSTKSSKPQSYITYRSCITPATGEKLSVLGFEGIAVFILFVSGTFMYYRKKRSVATMPGVGATRIPTHSRF